MAQTPARKRVRKHPDERRREILAEAARLIGERGYHGFGIRELAQRCAVSHPGLLRYFASKEELLVAVLEDRDQRDAEVVTAELRLPDTPGQELTLDQVREVFRTTAERNSRQPELVRLFAVLQAEALNPEHPAHAFFQNRQRKVRAAYAALLRRFFDAPDSAALQLMVTMDGLQQEWLRAAPSFDLAAEWDRAFARIAAAAKYDTTESLQRGRHA